MKILIPKEQSNYLEMLTYEVQCYQDLLTFMTNHGISKDISQDYFEKYQDYYIELTLAKVQLEAYLKTQIDEPLINWSLDFFTSEVNIND